MTSYEFRKYQTGATPFWIPQRFPGQYYDAETDLFENRNRYYDPGIGRYLQPEVLLSVSPTYASSRARQGLDAPAYAYAGNNAVANVDPTGLYQTTTANECPNYHAAADLALKKAGCGTDECDNCDKNSCCNMVKKLGGCDICSTLREGNGPLLSFKDYLFYLEEGKEGTLARTFGISVDGQRVFVWVQSLKTFCNGAENVDPLASVLIHEAMHVCDGPQHIPDPVAAHINKRACNSSVPNER